MNRISFFVNEYSNIILKWILFEYENFPFDHFSNIIISILDLFQIFVSNVFHVQLYLTNAAENTKRNLTYSSYNCLVHFASTQHRRHIDLFLLQAW